MWYVSTFSLFLQLADGSNSVFAQFYCCSIIVFGSYFLLNLILAVIMTNFTRIQQSDAEKELKFKEIEYKKRIGKNKNMMDDTTSSEEEEQEALIPSPYLLSLNPSPEPNIEVRSPREKAKQSNLMEEFKEVQQTPLRLNMQHMQQQHQYSQNLSLDEQTPANQILTQKQKEQQNGKYFAKGLGMTLFTKALVGQKMKELEEDEEEIKEDGPLTNKQDIQVEQQDV